MSSIYTFYLGFKPSPYSKILVMCQTQGTTIHLPIYNIFVPQKVHVSKISDDVIACDVWFALPSITKNPSYAFAADPLQRNTRAKINQLNICFLTFLNPEPSYVSINFIFLLKHYSSKTCCKMYWYSVKPFGATLHKH